MEAAYLLVEPSRPGRSCQSVVDDRMVARSLSLDTEDLRVSCAVRQASYRHEASPVAHVIHSGCVSIADVNVGGGEAMMEVSKRELF